MQDCLSGFLSLEIALRYNLRNIISKFSIKINEKTKSTAMPVLQQCSKVDNIILLMLTYIC
jgi:hypothetical protein